MNAFVLQATLPGLAFVATGLAVFAALRHGWMGDTSVDRRMDELEADRPRGGEPRAGFLAALVEFVNRIVDRVSPQDREDRGRLQKYLEHAGFEGKSAAQVFLAVQIGLVGIPLLVTLLAVGLEWTDPVNAVLFGGAGAAMGFLAPRLWLEGRQKRRRARLERSLPDFLDLIVTCVEGGLSVEASLQRVAHELRIAHPELAHELARVQGETDLGGTPEEALANLARRTGVDGIRTLSSLVGQSRRYGAGITEGLRAHADSLRDQREQRAEEAAQKSAVKILLPTLLCIFPAVFVVLAGPAAIKLAERFGPNAEEESAQSSRS